MKKEDVKTMKFVEKAVPTEGMRLGRIIRIDESGLVLVDFSGNLAGPVSARVSSSAKTEIMRKSNPSGTEVILIFENNDPKLPVIIDTMYSLIDEISESSTVVLEAEHPQEVTIDGKRVSFDAEDEIVFKCGKAGITLTREGKVLIRGEYVLSHSSGENRIRGGSVSIN